METTQATGCPLTGSLSSGSMALCSSHVCGAGGRLGSPTDFCSLCSSFLTCVGPPVIGSDAFSLGEVADGVDKKTEPPWASGIGRPPLGNKEPCVEE